MGIVVGMEDYFEICKMTNQEVYEAILEAHRDNDTHDVKHYASILKGRIEQLEDCRERLQEALEFSSER